MSRIEDFSIAVPQSELDDLRDRLRHTRWPEAETVDDWSQGVPLAYMRRLSAEWSETYDWHDTQARLNALPHVRTEIDGLRIHAVHARSPMPSTSGVRHCRGTASVTSRQRPGGVCNASRPPGPN